MFETWRPEKLLPHLVLVLRTSALLLLQSHEDEAPLYLGEFKRSSLCKCLPFGLVPLV